MRSCHFYLLPFLLIVRISVSGASVKKTSDCARCGSGEWVRLEDEPFCYKFAEFGYPMTFEDNLRHCKNNNATLPILKKREHRDSFKSLVQLAHASKMFRVFIGLNKVWHGKWTWVDGSRLSDSIENLLGYPINDTYDVVYLTSSSTGQTYKAGSKRSMRENIMYCQKNCPTGSLPSTTKAESTHSHQPTTMKPTVLGEQTGHEEHGHKARDQKRTSQGTEKSGGLGVGGLIGIIAGSLALALLLVEVVVVVVKRRRRATDTHTSTESGSQQSTVGAGASIHTNDLFLTEIDRPSIATEDLFNKPAEADNTSATIDK